jgi:hypothetical protein
MRPLIDPESERPSFNMLEHNNVDASWEVAKADPPILRQEWIRKTSDPE